MKKWKALSHMNFPHVKHYDILIGTIAATFAGAISFIANMLQFGAMFGNRERKWQPYTYAYHGDSFTTGCYVYPDECE